jgi:hypothetical protein
LRTLPVMTQARNAISRKINSLLSATLGAAGQKARVAKQALPGADAREAVACR